MSTRYTGRLTETGVEPSVGSVGASHDDDLAERTGDLYKAQVIHRQGPSCTIEALEWMDRFDRGRL